MIIKTKFRIDTVPINIIIIILLTVAPYFAFSKLIQEYEHNYYKEPSIFLLFIFIGILWIGALIYLNYKLITETLVVTINDKEKVICFNYPFKFQRKKYPFNEVIGFKFSSFYTGICDFKNLIIKTNNNTQYNLSEFQITNFKVFEVFLLEHFKLTKGNSFEDLSEEEKDVELLKN